MKVFDGNWQAFLARTLVFGVVVFGAVKLAVADPGGPASPNSLTYSGVLRNLAGTGPLSGAVTISFTLRRADGTSCPPVMVSTTANASGAFSALVSTARCPSGFFNGDAINYDVNLVSPSGEAGPLTPDGGVAITPVPYARFADQAGVNSECPAGYETGTLSTDAPGTVCVRNVILGSSTIRDEVVRVGSGATSFWVDRWEAGIFLRANGTQLSATALSGVTPDDIESAGLRRSGYHSSGPTPVIALSRVGVPSVNVTWFQANEACRAVGKRLLSRSEWFAAAIGTPDSATLCNVTTDRPAAPSPTAACVSSVGAFGMVGNVSEWIDEWYANAGTSTTIVNDPISMSPWPMDYGDGEDRTWNVGSYVERGSGQGGGMPAAAIRGGNWSDRVNAGVFALSLDFGPTVSRAYLGFRCMTPR